MKLDRYATILSGIGAGLITFAICYEYLILPSLPASTAWSREDAEALVQASMDYHAKSFDASVTESDLAQSEADYQVQAEKLENAQTKRASIPKYFHYTGIAFVLAGAGCYVGSKVVSDD